MQTASTKHIVNTASVTHGFIEASKIYGEMLVSIYDTSGKVADSIEKKIQELVAGPRFEGYREKYLELVNKLKQSCLIREYKITNLITTVGRATIAQRLANDTTYTGIINYGALGDDNTAVANADTALGNEVFRKVVASASDADNVAFIDFFYSKTDTNSTDDTSGGAYEEFATFIDGTGSADTGQIFTHALTGGWTKSATESMTVSCTYTIS